MPRIRSLHPEQFTDDDFVTCSPLSRLLALGLRNQADDNSIFEWNPIKLKMRILPADNCDVAALLDELVITNQVLRFTAEGREFGMIRSFQRFQKPKKPSFQHPIPSEPLPKGYALSARYSGTSAPLSAADVGSATHINEGGSSTSSEPVGNERGKPMPVVVEVEVGNGEGVKPTPPPDQALSRVGHISPESPVAALRFLVEQDARITLDTKGRMHLGQWATEGLTAPQLEQAIRLARQRKPHPTLIPFAYLVPIVEDVKAGRAIYPEEPRGKDAIPEALRLIAEREAREAAPASIAAPAP